MVISEWLIALTIFAILAFAYKIGHNFGLKYTLKKMGGHKDRVANIQAGLMGLLGVMLAFSFSLSSQRFEKRRQLVIQESMNIGTAYFRAGLLPDTIKIELRNLMEEYLDQRITYYQTGLIDSQLDIINKKSEDLQVQIWAKTAELGKTAPNLNTNITILALNEMIDIGGNINSDFQSHVSKFILLLLTFMCICTLSIMGYSDGLTKEKNLLFALILNMVLCSTLLLIIDMDSPTSGFIKADIFGHTGLKKEIETYSKMAKAIKQ